MNKNIISAIGNTKQRMTLGNTTSLEIFRIMKTSLQNLISVVLGSEQGALAVYNSGRAVGGEMYEAFFKEIKEFDELIEQFSKLVKDLKIGIVSVIKADFEKGFFEIRVDECVSCSGTSNTGKSICDFEGGIIAGVLQAYLGKRVEAKETHCWGLGDNFCGFEVHVTA
ncbi:MAG: hypothetical protein ACD_79C00654G0003 [uncultured bacterium]|nr:MAG: hypothetical protein ACD_79C00654G0003 [uncultured bacterium]